jgi:hypothetical protein
MQLLSPQRGHRPKQLMRQFDRTIGRINPFLFAIAIGLAALYVTCLLALLVRLPVVHVNACARTADSLPASDVKTKRDLGF